MNHPVLGDGPVARGVLVITIACLYAGAVSINNNLIFSWLEFDDFRNLMFLPAGLKLFLVMLFGWRAVAGIAVGIAATALAEFPHVSMASALLLGGGCCPVHPIGVGTDVQAAQCGLSVGRDELAQALCHCAGGGVSGRIDGAKCHGSAGLRDI